MSSKTHHDAKKSLIITSEICKEKFVIKSKTCQDVKTLAMTSLKRYDVKVFDKKVKQFVTRMSRTYHDVKKFAMTSKSSS